MPLVTLQNVDYGVGGPLLLDAVDLSIDSGERVALIGRNGTGKSTLLKLVAGDLRPDDGEVRVQGGTRISRLEQEAPAGLHGSVAEVVAAGLHGEEPWRVDETLSRLELDGDAAFAALSGGLKRRALLARALVSQPDVLLLDEPTNHLSIALVDELTEALAATAAAVVLTTHERQLLRDTKGWPRLTL